MQHIGFYWFEIDMVHFSVSTHMEVAENKIKTYYRLLPKWMLKTTDEFVLCLNLSVLATHLRGR